MPKILLVGDADLVDALMKDSQLPMTERERHHGTPAENERFGFELGSVETIIGYIATGIEAIAIARHLLAAAKRSKHPKLEIASPTGRVTVELEGKTDEEVALLVRAVLPFTR